MITLLDTNVFYYVLDIDSNDSINIEKLKTYIDTNKCECTIYTYFEFINNPNRTQLEKESFINYLTAHNINIAYDEAFADIKNDLCLYNISEENLKIIRQTIKKPIIISTSQEYMFFIRVYMYIAAYIYVSNYIKGNPKSKIFFKNEYMLLQQAIDDHVQEILLNNLNSLYDNNKFHEKEIKNCISNLLANIIHFYYTWLKILKILNWMTFFILRLLMFLKRLKKKS